ncbi:MAG: hypothetical protein ACRDHN_13395, partial [Thermomicrobiales bacterium]
ALERLFRRPLGKLSKRLGAADQLASDLESAVAARNHLAHHYLLDAIFRVNSGSSSVEEETSSLKTLFRRFEQLVSDLDDFQDARLSELGIDVSPDLSDAELERILREPHT